ncbi:MAG: hypothetical protein CMF89_05915 [Candidatus Marinimicrobia bacterium]|nr:hypothetical protein [Candidatus Neomarinimicrobiota bacterium]
MLKVDFSIIYFVFIVIFSFFLFNYIKLLISKVKKFFYLLILIRSVVIIILVTLIINPSITFSSFSNKTFDLVIDNSKSMKKYSQNLINNIKEIKDWGDKNKINFNFYIFGNSLRKIFDFDEIDFSDSYTDFSDFVNNYKSTNEVILFSDGLNNHGLTDINYKNLNCVNVIGYGNEVISDLDISIELLDTVISNDSIKINVLVKKNLKNIYSSGSIHLNNKFNKNYSLINYNLKENSYQKISLTLPINKTDRFNSIYITNNHFESNYLNNSFELLLPENKFSSKKLLLISGSISNNTSYIKKIIKNNLYDYTIDHIYRLNNNLWSKSINDFNFNDYSLLVFDDFPLYDDDNLIIDNLDLKNQKIIYFLGPNNLSRNYILDFCNCDYKNVDNVVVNKISNEYFYKGNYYTLPSNEVNHIIRCNNDTNMSYDNGNTFISKYQNTILFLIPNLKESSYKIDGSNLIFEDLILSVIDNEIYSNNRLFEIFVDTYNINIDTPLDVKIKLYDYENINDLFLNIYKDNKLYKQFDNLEKISLDLFSKEIVFNKSGEYVLQAGLELYNYNTNSNFINIIVNKFDREIFVDGINMEFLSVISNNTEGAFYKSINLDEFLENIEISKVNTVNYTKFDLNNLSYLLIIIIILLSLEWYIRNKVGLV